MAESQCLLKGQMLGKRERQLRGQVPKKEDGKESRRKEGSFTKKALFFQVRLEKNKRIILLFMQIKKEEKVFHYEETNLF